MVQLNTFKLGTGRANGTSLVSLGASRAKNEYNTYISSKCPTVGYNAPVPYRIGLIAVIVEQNT